MDAESDAQRWQRETQWEEQTTTEKPEGHKQRGSHEATAAAKNATRNESYIRDSAERLTVDAFSFSSRSI